MSKLKEYLEFPLDYLFKIIGENTGAFSEDTLNIFREKDKIEYDVTISKKETFKSISIKVYIENYEELEGFYVKIKNLKGLKYHL